MVDIIQKLKHFLSASPQKFPSGHAHVCLYVSILMICNQKARGNTVEVSRKKLMALSQIKSNATYHKCISELVRNSYISYKPSYHPILGSQIVIL